MISVSKRSVGSWVIQQVQAAERLDGTLKLRYCTTFFSKRFPPWVFTWVRWWGLVREVLIHRHVFVFQFVVIGSRTSNAEAMEDIASPLAPLDRRGVGEPRNLFPRLGLGEVCTRYAWNMLSKGTGLVGCRLDSPAEGVGALAPTV